MHGENEENLGGLGPIRQNAISDTPLDTSLTEEIADYLIRNSEGFIEKIKNIGAEPGDVLVSFDVTSLFTRVPVDHAAVEELRNCLRPKIHAISKIVFKIYVFHLRG